MLYCSKINFILVFHDQNSPRIQKYAFFGMRHVFLKTSASCICITQAPKNRVPMNMSSGHYC